MDIRTLAMILGITSFVQVVVFSFQASINRTYRGIGWWLAWSISAAAGFVFILLRAIPAIHKISIIAQNSLLVLGVIFLYIGIMRFFDKKEPRGILLAIAIAFVSVMLYFTYVKDDITVRTIAIGVALAVVSLLSARDIYAYKLSSVKASANFIAAFFLAHGVLFVFRTAMVFAGADVSNMFKPSLFHVSAYLDAIVVSIIWTCGLIIMVSQRSNAEMAEATKHFKLIFNTGPDAAVITSLADGKIVDINHGFTALTGLSREEAIGKSSIAVPIWKNPADRQRIVAELRAKGFSENFEAEFLRKDGSQLIGLISAKIISLRGSPHIISVTRNISERKQVEDALQESEKKFRSLFNSMQEGMALHQLVYSPAGQPMNYRILDINPAFENFIGITRADALNRLATDLYAVSAPPYLVEYAQVAESGQTTVFETYFQPMDKHFRIIAFSPGPTLFATVFEDITKRKQVEEQLKNQLDELQRWQDVMLDREDRVQELKREINELCRRAGEAAPYPSQEAGPADAAGKRPKP
jgi:PAS domain S-box-containing protein